MHSAQPAQRTDKGRKKAKKAPDRQRQGRGQPQGLGGPEDSSRESRRSAEIGFYRDEPTTQSSPAS